MTLRHPTIPSDVLEPGERIVWSAQPRQGIRFRPSDWYVIPFSLVWFGFCIVWTAVAGYALYAAFKNADSMEIPFLFMFPLVGLAFCAVGYQFAIGRFFKDAAVRARTLYALTNKRAFIAVGGPGGSLSALVITRDTTYETTAPDAGFATLTFTSGTAIVADGKPNWDAPASFAFEDAPKLDDAKFIIRRIQEDRA
jgi:hypothetical protein